MKTLKLIIILCVLTLTTSCEKDDEKTLATITTMDISGITDSSAIGGGKIIKESGGEIIEKGVCWSSNKIEPTILDDKIVMETDEKEFSGSVNGLLPKTTYYLRAYVTNSVGTAYGNTVFFKTNEGSPIVSTSSIVSVTQNAALCGGTVSPESNILIIGRGVCWGTESKPDISGKKTNDGTGYGSFTSNIDGLIPNTTYYVRAYATNSEGITSYGADSVFKTKAGLPVQITSPVSQIGHATAQSGGNFISDDGLSIVARGVCWSDEELPTIADNITVDGAGSGQFVSNISGLTANSTYYVRAYATNEEGSTTYGDEKVFTTPSEGFEYPDQGDYGVNLLSLDASDVVQITSGVYSVRALLPSSRKLAITIKFYTHGTMQIDDRNGWNLALLTKEENLITFYDNQRNTDLDMKLTLRESGSAEISIYEDAQEAEGIPSRIIQLSW